MPQDRTPNSILWAVITGIMVPASLGLASYALIQVVDLKERVSRIEANRFTAQDSLKMIELISQGRETPPKWIVDWQLQVNARLDRIELRINQK